MKIRRHGKASIFTEKDFSKIQEQFKTDKYLLLLAVARYSGERWGAILQLKINDAYNPDRTVRDSLTFRAATRKARPDGSRETRQIWIAPALKDLLTDYRKTKDAAELASNAWLFPSGRDQTKHLSLRVADHAFRSAVAKAGLTNKGYSTHSTRRWFITKLYRAGGDLHTIQKLTGHRSVQALVGYIEVDPERERSLLLNL